MSLDSHEVHAVYEDIKQKLTSIECFYNGDEDILYRHLQEIFTTDWLKVSPTIDKRKVASKLNMNCYTAQVLAKSSVRRRREVGECVGWDYVTVVHVTVRPVPVWEALLSEKWWIDPREPHPFVFLHDYFCAIRDDLVKILIESVFSQKIDAIPAVQRQRVLHAIRDYLSSIVWYYLLYHYYKPRQEWDPVHFDPIVQLENLRDMINLAKEGCGMAYGLGEGEGQRVEIRLPVWNEKEYPVDIVDDEENSGVLKQGKFVPDAVWRFPWIDACVLKEGVFVPEKVWRFPERLTVSDIAREPNAEVRRIMINTMGNEKFLHQSNAVIIDERDGLKLYSVRVSDDRDLEAASFNLVQCVCPTSLRVFYLRVPPNITDANTAIAWTFGETRENYRPERET